MKQVYLIKYKYSISLEEDEFIQLVSDHLFLPKKDYFTKKAYKLPLLGNVDSSLKSITGIRLNDNSRGSIGPYNKVLYRRDPESLKVTFVYNHPLRLYIEMTVLCMIMTIILLIIGAKLNILLYMLMYFGTYFMTTAAYFNGIKCIRREFETFFLRRKIEIYRLYKRKYNPLDLMFIKYHKYRRIRSRIKKYFIFLKNNSLKEE